MMSSIRVDLRETSPPASVEITEPQFATWSDELGHIDGTAGKISYCRHKISRFLSNRPLIIGILRELTSGKGENERSPRMLFHNEWLIHMDARRRFSVRMYLHAPGENTVIHDHSSWGVLGAASGVMEINKFRRQDNGQRKGYARLIQTERLRCLPGDTDVILPLDEGIHQVGNPTTRTIAVFCVYGTPIRRLFINHYDLQSNRVTEAYPPRLKRRMLAEDALESLIRSDG